MQRYPQLAQSPGNELPVSDGARRQPFRQSHISLGVAGHWLHLLAVLSPLVLGETIKDPEKKWRAIRMASVGTAIATEALWTHRLLQKREQEEGRRR